MSKESTKAAFARALSTHTLLNRSPEEEASLKVYRKSEERTPFGAAVEVKDQTLLHRSENEALPKTARILRIW